MGEPSQTLVFDRVAEYDDPATLTERFDAFADTIGACATVTTTDDQDADYDLEVSSAAPAEEVPGVDERLVYHYMVDRSGPYPSAWRSAQGVGSASEPERDHP